MKPAVKFRSISDPVSDQIGANQCSLVQVGRPTSLVVRHCKLWKKTKKQKNKKTKKKQNQKQKKRVFTLFTLGPFCNLSFLSCVFDAYQVQQRLITSEPYYETKKVIVICIQHPLSYMVGQLYILKLGLYILLNKCLFKLLLGTYLYGIGNGCLSFYMEMKLSRLYVQVDKHVWRVKK